MFGNRYWGLKYYGDRYWGNGMAAFAFGRDRRGAFYFSDEDFKELKRRIRAARLRRKKDDQERKQLELEILDTIKTAYLRATGQLIEVGGQEVPLVITAEQVALADFFDELIAAAEEEKMSSLFMGLQNLRQIEAKRREEEDIEVLLMAA